MNQMLHITNENVKTVQDHAWFFVDHSRRPRAFTIGQKFFCMYLLTLSHCLGACVPI